jgi:hypothetical protein
MDEIISILLIFVSGFIVGWFFHDRSMLTLITQDPDKIISLLEKYKIAKAEMDQSESTLTATEVRVEKIGSMFYLYSTNNNEFLAQGTSIEDALEAIKKRYPDQNFKGIISKEDAEKMGLSKQS